MADSDSPQERPADSKQASDLKALDDKVEDLRKRCEKLEQIRFAAGATLAAIGIGLVIVFGIDPKNVAKEVARREAEAVAKDAKEDVGTRVKAAVADTVDGAVQRSVNGVVPNAVRSKLSEILPQILREETFSPASDAIERFKQSASNSAVSAAKDAEAAKKRLEQLKLQSPEKDYMLREIARVTDEARRRGLVYWSKPAIPWGDGGRVNLPTRDYHPGPPELTIPCRKGDQVFVLGCPLIADFAKDQKASNIFAKVGLVSGKGKEVNASETRFLGSGQFTSGTACCVAEAGEDGDLKFSATWKADTKAIQAGGTLVGWIIAPAPPAGK
jgi:hypothetical protein